MGVRNGSGIVDIRNVDIGVNINNLNDSILEMQSLIEKSIEYQNSSISVDFGSFIKGKNKKIITWYSYYKIEGV